MQQEPPSHNTPTGPSSAIDPPLVEPEQAVGLPTMPEGRPKRISKAPPCGTGGHKHGHPKGLPNAGKSTLLAAITLAKPDIADYPFTTLMPNLGRLDGDPSLGVGMYSSEATLADLPGLIEGAHLGKGLGRNFLRHLRRTWLVVHVVDAAAENPVNDYRTVKEELRMYNPDYLERPYIVVLNKIDLPEARDRLPSLTEEIMRIGSNEVPSEPERGSDDDALQSLTTEGGHADVSSRALVAKINRIKKLRTTHAPLLLILLEPKYLRLPVVDADGKLEPGEIEEEFAHAGTARIIKRFLTSRSPHPPCIPKEGFRTSPNTTLPAWLCEEDVNYSVSKFDNRGFTGGLNYYRALDLFSATRKRHPPRQQTSTIG
nr:putative gtp-binding protein obgc2 [Quercus suber]